MYCHWGTSLCLICWPVTVSWFFFLWLQRYYMSAQSSSPVYGVAFDPCQLFAVLDQSLHVLDFSVFRDTPGIRNPQYTLGWMPWWCWVLLGQFHRCYFFVQFVSPGAMWCTHSACRMYSWCCWGWVQSSFVLVPTQLWKLHWYPKFLMTFRQ